MPNQRIRVKAMNIDLQKMELFTVEGDTHVILQGDPELVRIKNEIIVTLLQNQVAEVELGTSANTNHYSEYEKQSGGLVKLFRVAKKNLKNFFAPPVIVDPVSVQVTVPAPEQAAREVLLAATNRIAAVEEVIKHATPVSSTEFNDKNLDDDTGRNTNNEDTMIAVIGGEHVIPDVHHMKSHMAHANKTNDHGGLQKFLERVAKVASKRGHSVEDLMKFMKRNDMPIAADGSLIAYKALHYTGTGYVDIHSKNVPQDVGTRVFMSASLVDPDRHNDCSNGLHIARRGYVGGFRGSACFLVRIDPEDVIAVPVYDSNKMRVSGYDIIHRLSDDDYQKLCEDRPFTDNSGSQKVLADVLAGRYPPLNETVEITAGYGGGIIVTQLNRQGQAISEPVTTPISELAENDPQVAEAIIDVSREAKLTAPVLDPLAVVKEAAKTKAQQAQELFKVFMEANSGSPEEKDAARALLNFKRASKKGWAALGIDELDSDAVMEALED